MEVSKQRVHFYLQNKQLLNIQTTPIGVGTISSTKTAFQLAASIKARLHTDRNFWAAAQRNWNARLTAYLWWHLLGKTASLHLIERW